MILQALYEYYQRSRDDLAPQGFEYKDLSFAIVIEKDGTFYSIENLCKDSNLLKEVLVPKSVGRTSDVLPNLLWDKVEYVVGYSKDTKEKAISKAKECNKAFVDKCKEIASLYPHSQELQAVSLFYETTTLEQLQKNPLWPQIEKKPTVNLTFLLRDCRHLVVESEDVQDYVRSLHISRTKKQQDIICLVTGERCKAVKTTSDTKISGQTSGGKLVSFQVNSGYDSYGKKQCLNAPISPNAESAYTTALNKLLAKDSHNKFVAATRTFVFWAQQQTTVALQAEESLFALFGKTQEDDPNANILNVQKVFKAICSGVYNTSDKDLFYFLGLAPNNARIAVVYWQACSLKEFAGNILQHFDDTEMVVDTRKEQRPYQGLYSLLDCVAQDGKSSSVNPNLPEALFKSIIQGAPYPYALFNACIRRIRAEQQITIARAALLKAYLNYGGKNEKYI